MRSQVTIILDTLPDYTPPDDSIFISSYYNGYLSGDFALPFHKNPDGKWEITLTHPDNYLYNGFSYLLNRGTQKTVATDSLDLVHYYHETFAPAHKVRARIYNWYDRPGKPSTAAWNVHRISENFPMPQLGRTRGISVYLPPYYDLSEKSCPVAYLHDGQEVFDRYASFNSVVGDWNVDDVLNEMASEGIDY